MARAVLTPSRQLVVGAAAVAAALATVAAGVWLAASGSPRLDRATERAPIGVSPASVLDAASPDDPLAVTVAAPRSVVDILTTSTSDATVHPAVVPTPPGGGLAAQPPDLPPPPSPPPGADPDPVAQLVETVERTVDDTRDTVDSLDAVDAGSPGDVVAGEPEIVTVLP